MLNLNSFGRRVLAILRQAGDVVLFVGRLADRESLSDVCPPAYSQERIDGLTTDDVHCLIGRCNQQCRFDRWQEAKRTSAVAIGQMIDLVVQPVAVDLSPDRLALIAVARRVLNRECLDMLESGYSIGQTATALGLNRSTLKSQVMRLKSA